MPVRLWLVPTFTVCKIKHILATMKNEQYTVQNNDVFCYCYYKLLVVLHIKWKKSACMCSSECSLPAGGSVTHLHPHLTVTMTTSQGTEHAPEIAGHFSLTCENPLFPNA